MPETVAASPGADSGGLSASELREQVVMASFLRLKGGDAKQARAALQDAGLWPILDVADDRLSEAADILADVVEAAVAAGRLP